MFKVGDKVKLNPDYPCGCLICRNFKDNAKEITKTKFDGGRRENVYSVGILWWDEKDLIKAEPEYTNKISKKFNI